MYTEEHSPYDLRPRQPARPPGGEAELTTLEVQTEQKTFRFGLRENSRGRMLRITEFKGSFKNSIIIPAEDLEEFARALNQMVEAARELPPSGDGAPGNMQ